MNIMRISLERLSKLAVILHLMIKCSVPMIILIYISGRTSCSSVEKAFVASLMTDSPDYEESFTSSLEALSQPQEREIQFSDF